MKETNIREHMAHHAADGSPELPIPYPWNSPFDGMGDLICKQYFLTNNVERYGEFNWRIFEDGPVDL